MSKTWNRRKNSRASSPSKDGNTPEIELFTISELTYSDQPIKWILE
jgi:hypothetical protein